MAAKKKEEEKKTQQSPVIGTGSAAVDNFLSQPVLPALGNAISSFVGAITPTSSAQPSTMAGVRPIPEGTSASQLNPIPLLTGLYGTPLVRGSEAQRSEPRQTLAVSTTLPSGVVMSGGSADIYPAPRQPIGPSPFAFDVTKTQTPSSQPITASLLTGQTPPLSFVAPAPAPVTPLPPMPEPRTRYSLEYGRGSAMLTQQQQQNVQAAYARQRDRAERMAQFQNTLAEIRANRPKLEQERMIASQREDAERMARVLEGRKIDLAEQLQKERERGGSGRDVFTRLEQARVRSELARRRASNIGTGQRTPFFSYEEIKMPSGESAYSGSMGQFRILNRQRPQLFPVAQSQSFQSPVMTPNPFSSEENPFGSIFGRLSPYGVGV